MADEIERFRDALELAKSRLDDLVELGRSKSPFDPPHDPTAILIGTANRIGMVLEGGRFTDPQPDKTTSPPEAFATK
jgi:hypothetical protein